MEFFVRWALDGCLEVLELIASRVGYDNSASGLIAEDVQGAIDEIALATGAGTQFSFTEAKDGQEILIPDCQQMVVCGGFCANDTGGFCVSENASIAVI